MLEKYNLEFNKVELQTVVNALADVPYKFVSQLLASIQAQVSKADQQVAKAEQKASAAAPERKAKT